MPSPRPSSGCSPTPHSASVCPMEDSPPCALATTSAMWQTGSTRSSSRRSMPARVAFVIDELEVGGSQRQLFLMATGLLTRGWQVDVVCLQPILTLAPEFEEAGVPVHLVPKRRRLDVG